MLIYKCTFCCNSIFKLYMLIDQGKNWDVSKIMEIQNEPKKKPHCFPFKKKKYIYIYIYLI